MLDSLLLLGWIGIVLALLLFSFEINISIICADPLLYDLCILGSWVLGKRVIGLRTISVQLLI